MPSQNQLPQFLLLQGHKLSHYKLPGKISVSLKEETDGASRRSHVTINLAFGKVIGRYQDKTMF